MSVFTVIELNIILFLYAIKNLKTVAYTYYAAGIPAFRTPTTNLGHDLTPSCKVRITTDKRMSLLLSLHVTP